MKRDQLAAVIVFGAIYLVVGVWFPNPPASSGTQFAWRLAAWGTCAAAFAMHVALEHIRFQSSPRTTALHAAEAVARGAFGLATAANVHALRLVAGNRPLLGVALVAWPVVTALPAFLVALVIATGLARVRPTKIAS